MDVTKALLQSSGLVILGGPGSGKTTLLRHLALAFAREEMPQEYVRRLTFTHQDEMMDHLIPIFVRLQEFAESDQDLVPYLVDFFADHGFPYAASFLETKLDEGQCLVLFDGLDEVTDRGEQERVIRHVREVAGTGNQVLVSTRPVGYGHQLGEFLHLELVPFVDEVVEQFIANWFAEQPARADALLLALELTPRMRSMAANALLLSLLAVAWDRQGVPSLRVVDLYDECVGILLGEEADAALWTCAQRLAYHCQALRRSCLSGDELLTRIAQILSDIGENQAQAEDVVTALVGDAGLLRLVSKDAYAFSHLVLQEYLAAKEVFQCGNVVMLVERLDDPWWQELIVLVAGLQRDATDLVEAIEARSWHCERALLLAGRCLHDADQTDDDVKDKIQSGLFGLLERDNPSLWSEAVASIAGMEKTDVEDALTGFLKRQNPDERKNAAIALGRIGDGRTVPFLIGALDDDDREVCAKAVQALGRIADESAVQPIIKALADDKVEEACAAKALASFGEPAISRLVRALKGEEHVRETAVVALGLIGARAVAPLASALGDEDDRRRDGAVAALGHIGTPAVPALAEALKAGNETARKGAVDALSAVGNERAAETLIRILAEADRGFEEEVRGGLVAIGRSAVGPLMDALGHRKAAVRERASETLATIGEAAIESLIAALGSADGRVRAGAVTALASIGQPAVRSLIGALDDEGAQVRLLASEALGQIGDQRSAQALLTSLRDEDAGVRAAAVVALARTGDRQAMGPLVAALQDEERNVQQKAAVALGQIGDERALGPLIRLLSASDLGIRETAASSLVRIGTLAVEPLVVALYDGDSSIDQQRTAAALGEIAARQRHQGGAFVGLANTYHELLTGEHSIDQILEILSDIRGWEHWSELDRFFRAMARLQHYASIPEIQLRGDNELRWRDEVSEWFDPSKERVLSKLSEVVSDVKRIEPDAHPQVRTEALLRARKSVDDLRDLTRELLRPEAEALRQVVDAWSGELSAAIGRGQLAPHLKLKLRPDELYLHSGAARVTLDLVLTNDGFTPAQALEVQLQRDETQFEIPEGTRPWAYIPLLREGEDHSVEFTIVPNGLGVVELKFDIAYQDSQGEPYSESVQLSLALEKGRPSRPIPPNPYTVGERPERLPDQSLFKGRGSELGELRRAILAAREHNQGAILVHGQRRTGKTWLVRRFLAGLCTEDYISTILDIRAVDEDYPASWLLFSLARRIHEAVGRVGLSAPEPSYVAYQQDAIGQLMSFSDGVEKKLGLGVQGRLGSKTLVLAIDEVDLLVERVGKNKMSDAVFEYLAAWIQGTERIAVILIGADKVRQYLNQHSDSLLFSKSVDIPLDVLGEKPARELITKPLEGWDAVEYDSAAIDKVLRITSRYPYFIQRMCYLLVDLATEEGRNYITLTDVNDMVSKAILTTADVLDYYFAKGPSKSAQRVLAVLAGATDDYRSYLSLSALRSDLDRAGFGSVLPELLSVIEELEHYCLVKRSAYGHELQYAVKLPLLGMWLQKEDKLMKLRAEERLW
jgi:HEAT repeat protein